MSTSTIDLAVIPGDGIGPEVTAEALKVLEQFKLDGVAEKIECDLLVVHGSEDRQNPEHHHR